MKILALVFIICIIAASLSTTALAGNGAACLGGCEGIPIRLVLVTGLGIIILGAIAIVAWRKLRSR